MVLVLGHFLSMTINSTAKAVGGRFLGVNKVSARGALRGAGGCVVVTKTRLFVKDVLLVRMQPRHLVHHLQPIYPSPPRVLMVMEPLVTSVESFLNLGFHRPLRRVRTFAQLAGKASRLKIGCRARFATHPYLGISSANNQRHTTKTRKEVLARCGDLCAPAVLVCL